MLFGRGGRRRLVARHEVAQQGLDARRVVGADLARARVGGAAQRAVEFPRERAVDDARLSIWRPGLLYTLVLCL